MQAPYLQTLVASTVSRSLRAGKWISLFCLITWPTSWHHALTISEQSAAPTHLSRWVRAGGPAAGGEALPGKYLTGCCFQSRWWYYILSGWRRRGSPVGASRRPGEVCWSLRGAAHTHTHTTYTQMVSISQLCSRHWSLTLTLVADCQAFGNTQSGVLSLS